MTTKYSLREAINSSKLRKKLFHIDMHGLVSASFAMHNAKNIGKNETKILIESLTKFTLKPNIHKHSEGKIREICQSV